MPYPDNLFAQIEQAALEPSALVPGIGFSPDQMLLGRAFADADTHRHRVGANYLQLPVNRPRVEVNTSTQDGPMAYEHRGDDPVYAPNSFGRGDADEVGVMDTSWGSDGEMVRQVYTLRERDDDFSQAGTLVREVWNDGQADRGACTFRRRPGCAERAAGRRQGGRLRPDRRAAHARRLLSSTTPRAGVASQGAAPRLGRLSRGGRRSGAVRFVPMSSIWR